MNEWVLGAILMAGFLSCGAAFVLSYCWCQVDMKSDSDAND